MIGMTNLALLGRRSQPCSTVRFLDSAWGISLLVDVCFCKKQKIIQGSIMAMLTWPHPHSSSLLGPSWSRRVADGWDLGGLEGARSRSREDKIGAHAECCNSAARCRCQVASSEGRLRLIPEIFPLREKREKERETERGGKDMLDDVGWRVRSRTD